MNESSKTPVPLSEKRAEDRPQWNNDFARPEPIVKKSPITPFPLKVEAKNPLRGKMNDSENIFDVGQDLASRMSQLHVDSKLKDEILFASNYCNEFLIHI